MLPYVLGQYQVDAESGQQTGVVGVLLVVSLGTHLLDTGWPCSSRRGRHTSGHVGLRIAGISGGNGDVAGGAGVLFPMVAQSYGP